MASDFAQKMQKGKIECKAKELRRIVNKVLSVVNLVKEARTNDILVKFSMKAKMKHLTPERFLRNLNFTVFFAV